jgi:hypothetical protein
MRWAAYKTGDVRERWTFAWFPTRVGDEMRWLSFIRVTERYQYYETFGVWIIQKRA